MLVVGTVMSTVMKCTKPRKQRLLCEWIASFYCVSQLVFNGRRYDVSHCEKKKNSVVLPLYPKQCSLSPDPASHSQPLHSANGNVPENVMTTKFICILNDSPLVLKRMLESIAFLFYLRNIPSSVVE